VIMYYTNTLSSTAANLVTMYEMPTSFLAPLPGNGSCFDTEPSSSAYHSTYLMDLDPTLFEISSPKGDHLVPPPSSHPIKTPSYELHPALIALVQENSFIGTKEERPYIHVREFEQVCLIIVIEGMTQQTLKWKLFPFSLVGKRRNGTIPQSDLLLYVSSSDPTTRNPLYPPIS
jgi:hypothetical protein